VFQFIWCYFRCSINAESSAIDQVSSQLHSFLGSLSGAAECPPTHTQLSSTENLKPKSKTHFSMDFSVNYAGMSVPTVEYLHEDFAPYVLLILLFLQPMFGVSYEYFATTKSYICHSLTACG